MNLKGDCISKQANSKSKKSQTEKNIPEVNKYPEYKEGAAGSLFYAVD